MYNLSLKNVYIRLRSYFSDYNFVLSDGLSVVDVAIFKINENKENDKQDDIFIGSCKIPYELCFYDEQYLINMIIENTIKGKNTKTVIKDEEF